MRIFAAAGMRRGPVLPCERRAWRGGEAPTRSGCGNRHRIARAGPY